MPSAQKISLMLLADSSTVRTVSLPSLDPGEEYIVMRNIWTSSKSIPLLRRLLQLFVTSFEKLPWIIIVLRLATAVADGLNGLLADELSGCVAPEVSESIPIEIEHDLYLFGNNSGVCVYNST